MIVPKIAIIEKGIGCDVTCATGLHSFTKFLASHENHENVRRPSYIQYGEKANWSNTEVSEFIYLVPLKMF